MEQQVECRGSSLALYEAEKKSNKDHVATPRYVVESIYKLLGIEQYNSIWFPFNHYDSEFKLKADELKLKYRATHIFDDLGRDFFKTEPPEGCDLLISNPPFSIQNDIIKRTFELIDAGKVKACCLLLPLATLETSARAEIYEKHADKLSVLIFKKRIKFLGHTEVFNRGCCWICYNIENLMKDGKRIFWV